MLGTALQLALAMTMQAGFIDTAHTAEGARLIESWRSQRASYGPCFDEVRNRWIVTQDASHGAVVASAEEFSKPLQSIDIVTTSRYKGLGYLTIAGNGEAYGVSYRMGTRQPYATIVRIDISEQSIIIGDPVPSIVGDVYSSCPAIAPDGSRMIFSTDRSGGAGQTDLWFVERQPNNSWSLPQHCGEAINSPRSETTPFFVSNDTLLFSSDGFGGKGGMDVYMSVFRDGAWQDPVPLEDVNTELDETDAVKTRDGRLLFARNTLEKRQTAQLWLMQYELDLKP